MAPGTFARVAGKSATVQQPRSAEERAAAMRALLACPTYSIHNIERLRGEVQAASASFPLPLPGCASVFHLGFHSSRSFGAASYFIRRPFGGNILVDTPRWNPRLAQRLEQLGGVAWVFLTHRDDVADHAAWALRYGARRIIHALEASRRQGTECVRRAP